MRREGLTQGTKSFVGEMGHEDLTRKFLLAPVNSMKTR
jgi:hypothetical protein